MAYENPNMCSSPQHWGNPRLRTALVSNLFVNVAKSALDLDTARDPDMMDDEWYADCLTIPNHYRSLDLVVTGLAGTRSTYNTIHSLCYRRYDMVVLSYRSELAEPLRVAYVIANDVFGYADFLVNVCRIKYVVIMGVINHSTHLYCRYRHYRCVRAFNLNCISQ